MNLSFKIIPYETGGKASIYTIIIEGEEQSEFDKFLSDPDIVSCGNLEYLLVKIENIINGKGARPGFFKAEGPVEALYYGSLRLYCCRFSEALLIIGSGGIKRTRTFQQDPILNKSVKTLVEIVEMIDERIRNREIFVRDKCLEGNLVFKGVKGL